MIWHIVLLLALADPGPAESTKEEVFISDTLVQKGEIVTPEILLDDWPEINFVPETEPGKTIIITVEIKEPGKDWRHEATAGFSNAPTTKGPDGFSISRFSFPKGTIARFIVSTEKIGVISVKVNDGSKK